MCRREAFGIARGGLCIPAVVPQELGSRESYSSYSTTSPTFTPIGERDGIVSGVAPPLGTPLHLRHGPGIRDPPIQVIPVIQQRPLVSSQRPLVSSFPPSTASGAATVALRAPFAPPEVPFLTLDIA